MALKYVSDGTWFDKGTEAKLIVDCESAGAIFSGIREGKPDEELCSYDEFDVYDQDGKLIRKATEDLEEE